MAYRSVIAASSPSRIFTRQRHLCIENEEGQGGRIPLEDLAFLIVESRRATLTSASVDELAGHGAAIVFCGADHMPTALTLPLSGHSTHTERLRNQIAAPTALKRQLWAFIVRTKIRGQASNLEDGPARIRLQRLISEVRSGDPKNLEAQAAKAYWSALFSENDGNPFKRQREGNGTNALLNYGYAIIRAAVARSLVGSGLNPAIGIHHSSRSNPFCLADDLLEVFRPLVDRRVHQWIHKNGTDLTMEARQHMVAFLAQPIPYGNEKGPLFHLIEQSTASLAKLLDRAAHPNGKARWERAVTDLVVPHYDDP